jgi:DNA-binding response OmpR family regulator
MTGHPGNEPGAMASGASAFVTKPFNTVEVLSRVYSLLEARLG